MMVMKEGCYLEKDYVRLGLPLQIMCVFLVVGFVFLGELIQERGWLTADINEF